MITINKLSSSSPVDFAAEELKKYLRMMMPKSEGIEIKLDPDAKTGYILGTTDDFGFLFPEVEDSFFDDLLHLENKGDAQIISGSNPRSVLLAVYKYLKLNGCRWLFPGIDGEYIPMKKAEFVDYHKMADNRFRGQCNEGSTRQEHYLAAIDFLPKIGMNTYMLEFENPNVYYDKWYNHLGNPLIEPEPVSRDTILQWKRECEFEIQKRGLIYHDMGHGWTQLPFGIKSETTVDGKRIAIVDDPSQIPLLALIRGSRDPRINKTRKSAVNSCLSNSESRKKIIDYFTQYAKEQSNVDVMHVWLADDGNGHCECEECAKKTASDWYIILLNEMDEALTKLGSPMRIDFIVYQDTVWAPLNEKLNNPSRFVQSFAPISRLYDISYSVDSDFSDLTGYVRNKNKYPTGISSLMAYFAKWREFFGGDAFAYEYHFWRLLSYEPSQQHIAHIIYDDAHGLKKHELRGIIEDSTPRNYMPGGFAQTVFGESLFDLSVSFEELEKDYYSHAFGDDWEKVRDFLEIIGNPVISADILRMTHTPLKDRVFDSPEVMEAFKKWLPACDEFEKTVAENQNPPVRSRQVLWRNMKYFVNHIRLYEKMWVAKYSGDDEGAFRAYTDVMHFMRTNEVVMNRFHDVGQWFEAMRHLMNPGKKFPDPDVLN